MAYQQELEQKPFSFRRRVDVAKYLEETAKALKISVARLINDTIAQSAGLPTTLNKYEDEDT